MTQETAAFVIAVMTALSIGLAARHARSVVQQRRLSRALWNHYHLLVRHQFRVATTEDIDEFMAWARSQRREALAQAQLDLAKKSNIAGVREGHLWATAWKIRGLLPADAPLPPCSGKWNGIETMPEVEAACRQVGAVTLMKPWLARPAH